MNRNKKIAGFTLIEMLLVVAVLAVVGTMIVSQFGDTEKQAKQVAAIHNPKMLEQVTNDFKSLYGVFPTMWHTGLNTAGTQSVEGLGLQVALNMAGNATAGQNLPATAIANNFANGYQVLTAGANVKSLTAAQVRALRANGIHQLKRNGYTPKSDSQATPPIVSNPSTVDVDSVATLKLWILTGGENLFRGGSVSSAFPPTYTVGTEVVTIDGRALSTWSGFGGGEAVVLVACAKEVDWKGVLKGDPDRTGMGEFVKNSQIELPEAPRDPNAKSASAFPYYWAVFNISPTEVDGVGISAQLLGILDSELNPVQG